MQRTRRDFIKLAGAASALAIAGAPGISRAAGGRVVIIGGGFGGATLAKYVKLADRNIEVTLVERDAKFITCPFSNYVIGGFKRMEQITHSYDALKKNYGINVVRDEARAIDTSARSVSLKSGSKLAYDKLAVAPGIDLDFAGVPGYSAQATDKMPHAWKAGAQTLLLRRQLEAMPDGGTVILCPPGNPFRCPPGPYERASTIAWYLKNRKPKSKILILDAKDAFSKQGLFMAAWEAHYPGMITWIAGKDGGKVQSVDPATMTVKAGFGTEKGAVVNVIPPQRAGKIALDAGLGDDKGWCPVDPATFASTKAQNVFVVGDASIAGAMPKSGSSANTQAKNAAAAIVAQLSGQQPPVASLANTCYSLVTPDYGISVTAVFQVTDKGIVEVPGSGGASPAQAPAANRKLEAVYTEGWYAGITADSFG